jgi:cytochrome c biogenesis protein CcmG/thiol:disulfide interchange protein DsbE
VDAQLRRRGWRRFRACAAATLVLAAAATAARAPQVGQLAPALVAPQLDGRVFDLASLRGKVVIVNFWATWCAPCRAEMPLLDSFYQRYHAQGLELLGLSVDDASDRAEVVRVMRKFSYPAALGASAKVNGFGPPLAVPVTWIIDSAGVVRARLLAGTSVTEQSLTQSVLPLLPRLVAPAAP